MFKKLRLKIEKRKKLHPIVQLGALAAAIALSFLATGILMLIGKADVGAGFIALFEGAFGTWRACVETLVKATPLILTGLATVIAFRARIWNIGQESQLYIGGITAYWAYTQFINLPPIALIPIIVLFALLGGAICGFIPAVIKARFSVDEIITTIMLNYIVTYFLSWLLSGPWKDPNHYYQQSPTILESLQFPILIPHTRLHLGFALAIVAAVVIYLLIAKTPLGYEIQAMGLNPTAARFQGINVVKTMVIVMMISGALSGLAGAGELFGVINRLKSTISLSYGYTGIIIAMLTGLEPLAVVPVAILFGGLINGSFLLQTTTNIPSALVYVIQSIVLLFFLGARALSAYKIRLVINA
ncbi:MAG TPA: ABC transporter permease [Anaerolineales bacterium]|nr:ABC transporter permease [Anaerolineales bacterium]